jgi:hypothetical protein
VEIDRATETAEQLRQALLTDRHAVPFHARVGLGIREFDLRQMRIEASDDHIALCAR